MVPENVREFFFAMAPQRSLSSDHCRGVARRKDKRHRGSAQCRGSLDRKMVKLLVRT